MAKNNGLDPYPRVVAELGPGDSIGVGLAALVSGADRYLAYDVVKHANCSKNLKVFEELVTLFTNKTPIPGDDEFPDVAPRLTNYAFPTDIFDDARLKHALDKSRIEKIRSSVSNFKQDDQMITYIVSWFSDDIIEKESVDMIYSQAVLEHVDNLRETYRVMYLWLSLSGYMSHQIDFRCHETSAVWNGHWTYSDDIWKLIRGKLPYLLNREPHSTHTALLLEEGFSTICNNPTKSESSLALHDLAVKFRDISEADLVTSGAFIQAVKKIHVDQEKC